MVNSASNSHQLQSKSGRAFKSNTDNGVHISLSIGTDFRPKMRAVQIMFQSVFAFHAEGSLFSATKNARPRGVLVKASGSAPRVGPGLKDHHNIADRQSFGGNGPSVGGVAGKAPREIRSDRRNSFLTFKHGSTPLE